MECVIAIVILGIATPGMFMALRAAAYHSVGQLQASRARWLIQDQLEDLIADRHCERRGFSYLTAANSPRESEVADAPGFSRQVAFNNIDAMLAAAGHGDTVVTATVTYADWSGSPRSMAASTVLTEYTP